MQIQDLKINGVNNPVGFHLDRIICSWKVTDTSSRKQEKAEIQVSLDGCGPAPKNPSLLGLQPHPVKWSEEL